MPMSGQTQWLDFILPSELEAPSPPEARGMRRDQVRLMVSYRATNQIRHLHFEQLADVLVPGDLLVINTSGTMNAALPALQSTGKHLELHLSTHLPADLWVVELREYEEKVTRSFTALQAGEQLQLPDGGSAILHTPYLEDRSHKVDGPHRLWIATLHLPDPLDDYLAKYGFPIRYSYVEESWPLDYYQTVYTTETGSAEMPSAGRAFTPELITQLVAQGIHIAPLLLHTGVASLEEHESPYAEYYRVSAETAQQVNTAHRAGRRVIAVGTTVVRALETVTAEDGITYPGEGWTRLFITPQRGMRVINGLLTGFHEPRSTHLLMLEALADLPHLKHTYSQALQEKYLWHEFGDLHLLLP
jgi:S-adenosylmethionine:tRNA ribosyltransferase-isomerase